MKLNNAILRSLRSSGFKQGATIYDKSTKEYGNISKISFADGGELSVSINFPTGPREYVSKDFRNLTIEIRQKAREIQYEPRIHFENPEGSVFKPFGYDPAIDEENEKTRRLERRLREKEDPTASTFTRDPDSY